MSPRPPIWSFGVCTELRFEVLNFQPNENATYMTMKLHTEIIFMIKVLWNTIGQPENDPWEKEMTKTWSLHNVRVYYPPVETKQNSSFSDTDIEKEKEYR